MQLSTTGILLLFGFWDDSKLPHAETDLFSLDTVSRMVFRMLMSTGTWARACCTCMAAGSGHAFSSSVRSIALVFPSISLSPCSASLPVPKSNICWNTVFMLPFPRARSDASLTSDLKGNAFFKPSNLSLNWHWGGESVSSCAGTAWVVLVLCVVGISASCRSFPWWSKIAVSNTANGHKIFGSCSNFLRFPTNCRKECVATKRMSPHNRYCRQLCFQWRRTIEPSRVQLWNWLAGIWTNWFWICMPIVSAKKQSSGW